VIHPETNTSDVRSLKARRNHLRGLAGGIYATSIDQDRQHLITPEHLRQQAAYESELLEVESALKAAYAAEPLAVGETETVTTVELTWEAGA
jgi:hypothetical protein